MFQTKFLKTLHSQIFAVFGNLGWKTLFLNLPRSRGGSLQHCVDQLDAGKCFMSAPSSNSKLRRLHRLGDEILRGSKSQVYVISVGITSKDFFEGYRAIG